MITSRVIYSDQLGISEFLHIILCEKLQFAIWCAPKKVRRRVILNILYSCKSVAVKFSIILMALPTERIPNLPSHVSYISTLPDIPDINGDLQTLICVLVARPRRCLTLSNPVP